MGYRNGRGEKGRVWESVTVVEKQSIQPHRTWRTWCSYSVNKIVIRVIVSQKAKRTASVGLHVSYLRNIRRVTCKYRGDDQRMLEGKSILFAL